MQNDDKEFEQEIEADKTEIEAADTVSAADEPEIEPEPVETESTDDEPKIEIVEQEIAEDESETVSVDAEVDKEEEKDNIEEEADTEEEEVDAKEEEVDIDEEEVEPNETETETDIKEIEPESIEVRTNKALKHFNWGAFGFTWLWGLGNGSFGKTWHILILDIMSGLASKYALIVVAFAFIIRVFYGVNGNKWAFERRAWYSVEDYTETQRRWAKIFALLFGLFMIFFAAGVLIVIALLTSKHEINVHG